jgi:hypothetical protein
VHARRYGGLGAVVGAALLLAPGAWADGPSAWQGPVKVADWATEFHVQPARMGTDGVAIAWTEGPGAIVAYRAQGEGPLRTPLRIYDTDPPNDIWPAGLAIALRDGDALAVGTSDVSDRTLAIAPDGTRGPLQDWGDGCGIGALADSPVAGTAAIRICDDGAALSYSLTRRAVGALRFQDPQPAPIEGGDLPDMAIDDAGDVVATWLGGCDPDAGTCVVMAATATPRGAWSTPRELGTTTQVSPAVGAPEPLLSVDEHGDGVIAWPQEDDGAHHVVLASVTGGTAIGDAAVAATDTSAIATLFDVESYHGATAVEWITDVSDYYARLAGAVRPAAGEAMTTSVLAPSFGHAVFVDWRPSPAAASPDHRTFAMTLYLESAGERTILWRAGAPDFTSVDDPGGGGAPRLSVGDDGTALASWTHGMGESYTVADAGEDAFAAPASVPTQPGWYGPVVADQAVDDQGDALIEANDGAAPTTAGTQAYMRPAGGSLGASLPGLGGIYANGAGAILFSLTDAVLLRRDTCGDLAYYALSALSVSAPTDCPSDSAPQPQDISASAEPLVTPPSLPPPSTPGDPQAVPPAVSNPAPPGVAGIAQPLAGPPRLRVRLRHDGSLAVTVSCRAGCGGRLTLRTTLGSLHLRCRLTLRLTRAALTRTYHLRLGPKARRHLKRARRTAHLPRVAVAGSVSYADGSLWHGTVLIRLRRAQ